MNPDPGWLRAADLMNPQSLNLYTYALNNPLIDIDPTGLECVWSDGSYDSNDDPDTGNSVVDNNGNHTGCLGQGGAWVDHSYFTSNDLDDWQAAGTNAHGTAEVQSIYTALTSNSLNIDVNSDGTGWAVMNSSDKVGIFVTPVITSSGYDYRATWSQKNKVCLDKINGTPDGWFYNFFSPLSMIPGIGPDWKKKHCGGRWRWYSKVRRIQRLQCCRKKLAWHCNW